MSYSSPGLLTDESRWLAKIARQQAMLIHATQQGGGADTPLQYDLLSADTLILSANTYKSISFQVIKGSVSVSMDGGSTSITYPIGAEISIGGGIVSTEWRFLVAGSALDGLNQVLVQTTS